MSAEVTIREPTVDVVVIKPSTGPVVVKGPSGAVAKITPKSTTPAYRIAGQNVGPPGPPGSAFVFTQGSPLNQWTIAHNLGFRPGVTVTSLGGVEVLGGAVTHLSVNTLQIDFDVPFAGQARLN